MRLRVMACALALCAGSESARAQTSNLATGVAAQQALKAAVDAAASAAMACDTGCPKILGDELYPEGVVDTDCKGRCIDRLTTPPSPGVRPSGNNRAFVLLEPMVYQVGTTSKTITVPAGFVTDYASIPRILWSKYSPHDQYSRAAIVHDYLCWSQLCTRPQADNLFMIAMKESEVSTVTRAAVYEGVHLGGQSSWDDNKEERKANKPRVVPVTRKDFPPNWSWEMYRSHLIDEGVSLGTLPLKATTTARWETAPTFRVPGSSENKDQPGRQSWSFGPSRASIVLCNASGHRGPGEITTPAVPSGSARRSP